jgi:hypothetical protein
MKACWLLIASLGCVGCGSAMLKPPISEGCKSSGLKGCDDITDGVIAFVDGDQQKGTVAIAKGAAANAPGELQAFITVLRNLEKIPGTSSFMKPIMEVVAILEAKVEEGGGPPGATSAGESGGAAEAQRTTVAAPTITLPDRLTIVTAAHDLDNLVSGTVTPSKHPHIRDCGELLPYGEGNARCLRLRKGPFVVTDLSSTPSCKLFVAAGDPDDGADWILSDGLNVHGARLVVKEGRRVVVGVLRGEDENCSLTYGGFRPYVARSDAEEFQRRK